MNTAEYLRLVLAVNRLQDQVASLTRRIERLERENPA
jgi:ubiquinone biosynthesis protein UbiJ